MRYLRLFSYPEGADLAPSGPSEARDGKKFKKPAQAEAVGSIITWLGKAKTEIPDDDKVRDATLRILHEFESIATRPEGLCLGQRSQGAPCRNNSPLAIVTRRRHGFSLHENCALRWISAPWIS